MSISRMAAAMAVLMVGGAAGASMHGAQEAPGPLVSTEWVASRLNDPNLVVLHVDMGHDMGDGLSYASQHLRGARAVTLDAVSRSTTDSTGARLNLQMLDAEPLRLALEGLGISDGSRVVLYGTGPRDTAMVTRVWVTLQHAGLGARSHIMQGGLTAWVAEKRPTTKETPPSRTGSLKPLSVQGVVVDATEVDAARSKRGIRIIDARARSFYDGEQTGGGRSTPHQTGHISGAASVPFSSVVDADGRMKSLDDLRAAFSAAGVKPGESVIAYCHIGQQATVTLFAAKLLGHDIKLYDGSFEEWSRRPGSAVTNPSRK